MTITDLQSWFDERVAEIDVYFDFLRSVELYVQENPSPAEHQSLAVSPQQQRMLYSSVYLQLYNLVEATMTRCTDAISDAVTSRALLPHQLSDALRREWVRGSARTHIDLTYENRLKAALSMCDLFVTSIPVTRLEIDRGGGGNWDDGVIEDFAQKRIGFRLQFSRETLVLAKRQVRNDKKGALKVVRGNRNDLSHGIVSFSECSSEATLGDLEGLSRAVCAYLDELVRQFVTFVATDGFRLPTSATSGAVA